MTKYRYMKSFHAAVIIFVLLFSTKNTIAQNTTIVAPVKNQQTELNAHIQEGLSEDGVISVYDPNLDITLIYVKHGSFMMGANSGDQFAYRNAMPAHKVTITKDYCIGETEVTQKLWKKIMGTNPSYFKGDDLPVANVTYDEVLLFIKRINEKYVLDKSRPYRLPTEAEWEYAARGGHKMTNTIFAGSNNINEVASDESLATYSTNPPKKYKPNELGIYDMSGNVAELTADWYSSYKGEHQIDPKVLNKDEAGGEGHVYRGGINAANKQNCTVYYRMDFFSKREYYIGFRLCRDYK